MNRLLALPAVVCLLLGAALGAWGWTQRDEARERIIPVFDDGGDGGGGGGIFGFDDREPAEGVPPLESFEDDGGTVQACFELDSAAQLDAQRLGFLASDAGPSEGPPESVFTPATDPVSVGRTLVRILDPTAPALLLLDGPDPTVRMGEMQGAVEAALAAGRDPLTDAAVRQAAAALLPIVDALC